MLGSLIIMFVFFVSNHKANVDENLLSCTITNETLIRTPKELQKEPQRNPQRDGMYEKEESMSLKTCY